MYSFYYLGVGAFIKIYVILSGTLIINAQVTIKIQ